MNEQERQYPGYYAVVEEGDGIIAVERSWPLAWRVLRSQQKNRPGSVLRVVKCRVHLATENGDVAKRMHQHSVLATGVLT